VLTAPPAGSFPQCGCTNCTYSTASNTCVGACQLTYNCVPTAPQACGCLPPVKRGILSGLLGGFNAGRRLLALDEPAPLRRRAARIDVGDIGVIHARPAPPTTPADHPDTDGCVIAREAQRTRRVRRASLRSVHGTCRQTPHSCSHT
jgi:hypothetical protein